MSGSPWLELGCAVALALVHLAGGTLRLLEGIPRSRWLSAAGGTAVAYVFVHLLPELAEAQEAVGEAADRAPAVLEHHAYLFALAGLAVFYALEHMAIDSRRRRGEQGAEDRTGSRTLWVNAAAYGIYSGLVGYLIVHRHEEGVASLLFFALAMAVHFLVADFGLREHHKQDYRRVVRWILAAAVLGGWAIGVTIEVSEAALGLLLAFLAGGVILNTIKEEVPGERQARLLPFLAGAGLYAALLLAA